MSTYWYYECRDHTPPLRSLEEFTQHTGDTAFKRGIALLGERPLDPDWEPCACEDTYFESRARNFLVQHPHCDLAMINEYGEYWDQTTNQQIGGQ